MKHVYKKNICINCGCIKDVGILKLTKGLVFTDGFSFLGNEIRKKEITSIRGGLIKYNDITIDVGANLIYTMPKTEFKKEILEKFKEKKYVLYEYFMGEHRA
jgi:hypothetical protein